MIEGENMDDLKERIELVKKNIEAAKRRSGRIEPVVLVAASKTVDAARLRDAVKYGCDILGENRVQEFTLKYQDVPGAKWHLIGHLQKNKVKYVVGNVDLIHSVDSIELLKEINSRAEKLGISQDVLLELNISGEISKYGLTTEKIPDIINKIGELGAVRVRGFMTMAPLTEDKELVRSVFRRAREMFDKYDEFDILSMGMSGDYEIAVEEGATMVRVGSSIFGKRN